MRWLALAALLAACKASDPCAGHAGTCIALEVDGLGVDAVDQLAILISIEGRSAPLSAITPPAPGPTVALPARTAIYLDAAVSGNATLAVGGYLNGVQVGDGTTGLAIVAGAHQSATVILRSASGDGFVPIDFAQPPEDLAGSDLAGVDLAGSDFAQPPVDLAGADLGHEPACPAVNIFCDDFEGETGAFAKWNGATQGANATFGLDNTQPFLSGSTSFEVNSMGGYWALHKTLPTASGVLATRFYVYVPVVLTNTTTLIAFLNTDNTTAFSVAAGFDTTLTQQGFWKLHSTSDFFGPQIVLDKWQCVEVDVDLTAGTMQLYVTDATTPNRAAAPVITATLPTTSTPGPFYFGIYTIPSTAKADLWFDDIAIATQHIGCE
jgi:hypothetical protein